MSSARRPRASVPGTLHPHIPNCSSGIRPLCEQSACLCASSPHPHQTGICHPTHSTFHRRVDRTGTRGPVLRTLEELDDIRSPLGRGPRTANHVPRADERPPRSSNASIELRTHRLVPVIGCTGPRTRRPTAYSLYGTNAVPSTRDLVLPHHGAPRVWSPTPYRLCTESPGVVAAGHVPAGALPRPCASG